MYLYQQESEGMDTPADIPICSGVIKVGSLFLTEHVFVFINFIIPCSQGRRFHDMICGWHAGSWPRYGLPGTNQRSYRVSSDAASVIEVIRSLLLERLSGITGASISRSH